MSLPDPEQILHTRKADLEVSRRRSYAWSELLNFAEEYTAGEVTEVEDWERVRASAIHLGWDAIRYVALHVQGRAVIRWATDSFLSRWGHLQHDGLVGFSDDAVQKAVSGYIYHRGSGVLDVR